MAFGGHEHNPKDFKILQTVVNMNKKKGG